MEFDKEQVYDNELAPLVTRVIQVCRDNDIPMVASFCYRVSDDVEDVCTTAIPQRGGWTPAAFADCVTRLLRDRD